MTLPCATAHEKSLEVVSLPVTHAPTLTMVAPAIPVTSTGPPTQLSGLVALDNP